MIADQVASGTGASTAAPWPGPALLVPMTLEALVLTNASYNAAWSWSPPNYIRLGTFQTPEEPPFSRGTPLPGAGGRFTGVVLHWALPDGVTRGRATEGAGTVSYVNAPNRWLVVRKARSPQDPKTWAYQAWVIASDYVWDPSSRDTKVGSQFPSAAGSPFPVRPGATAVIMGRAWLISEWSPAAVTAVLSPPLTAIGAGDPTFAAYAPGVRNVFSFVDPLTDVLRGPLSYSVYGWYADAAQDPLYGAADYGPDGWKTPAQWSALMARLGWTLGDDQDIEVARTACTNWARNHGFEVDPSQPRATYPARIVCHGLLYDVGWLGANGPYLSGVPTPDSTRADWIRPDVAIGHSAIDALAALLADSKSSASAGVSAAPAEHTLVNLLEAFQHNLLAVLDQDDGQAQLNIRVQSGWFSSGQGGTSWEIVSQAQPEAPATNDQPPALTPEQADLLTQLNVAQRQLDDRLWNLASRQWQVYGLWWKNLRAVTDDSIRTDRPRIQALVKQALADEQSAIVAALPGIQALLQQRDDLKSRIEQSLMPTGTPPPAPLQLLSAARPPFFHPTDPVILIKGARRSFKHGEDGRFSEGDELVCRVTGQTVTGLQVPVGGTPVTVGGRDVTVPRWDRPGQPLEIADLDVESFFLDLTNAPVIAQAAARLGGSTDPWALLEAIRKEQSAIWNAALHGPIDPGPTAELSGLMTADNLGAPPSKVGVEIWAPPWTPLYIAWGVDFIPDRTTQDGALARWRFPSSAAVSDPLDDFTYEWTGPKPPNTSTGRIRLEGRTFLTPQASDVLAANLERFIADFADVADFQDDLPIFRQILERVKNADLLSQALSGLNLMLLQRLPKVFPTPTDGSLAPYLAPPGLPSLVPDSTPDPSVTPPQFNPIRAGHFAVIQLWVVDAFGQVFDVIGAQGETGLALEPILSDDLVVEGESRLTRLKPRLTQPARLTFDLVSATDDSQTIGVVTGADPVCGWLLRNQLDRGVLVYDAAGNLEGELILAENTALWLPPAHAAPPPSTGAPPPIEIANRHLGDLVRGIRDRPDSRATLEGLLALIDTAAWSTDPGGGWADQALPLLIGRPLAVVRARLALELQGRPVNSQRWQDTGQDAQDGFTQVSFPIQLGSTELLDDGLVGYYLADQYQQIHSAYRLSPQSPYVGGQLPRLSARPDDAALVTMVLDPHAQVHALSGLLPPLSISLPVFNAMPALSHMAITFRTGPLLNDLAAVAMPVPALRDGVWSWLQYQGTTAPARQQPIGATDATGRLPDAPPVLREGWLRLDLAGSPLKLTYTATPTAVVHTTDAAGQSTVAVQITAYNGSGADVACRDLGFVLPIGTGAAELTASAATVVASMPTGPAWTVSADGAGGFRAAPESGSATVKAGQSITFAFAGIQVNAEPGLVLVTIHERTDKVRHTALGVAKVAPVSVPAAQIIRFGATPAQVDRGGTSTLVWQVVGADACFMEPDHVPLDPNFGTLQVTVDQTTTYTLVATAGHQTVSRTMSVDVMPVVVRGFTAEPSTVRAGDEVRLQWTTQYASGCVIDQGIGPVEVNGWRAVRPRQTTTYTLTAQGLDTVTRQVTVQVTGG